MNKTLENTLNRVGSRFCTIVYQTTKSTRRFCAKVQSVGNSYVTISDISSGGVDRKINANSIKRVQSGNLVWSA